MVGPSIRAVQRRPSTGGGAEHRDPPDPPTPTGSHRPDAPVNHPGLGTSGNPRGPGPFREGEGPMRSLVTPLTALVTAAALTSGVCACGQAGAPYTAGRSTSPSTTSAPARPSAAAAPSVDEVFTRALAAVQDADSVHLRMTNDDGSHTCTLDVRGSLDGTHEQQSFSDSDGAAATSILVGDEVYIKANQAYWCSRLPALDTSRLPDVWVRLAGDVPAGFLSPVLMRMLLTDLGDWAPGTVRHQVAGVTVRTVGGTRSHQVDVGSATNALVVDARTWLPTSFTVLDPDTGAMAVVLDEWNSVERVTPPPVYRTLVLEAG